MSSALLRLLMMAVKAEACSAVSNFKNLGFETLILLEMHFNNNSNRSVIYYIMDMEILATSEDTKPNKENIRRITFASVEHTTVQGTRLPL